VTLAQQLAGLAALKLAARPLRAAMLDVLRPAVPFDAYVFVMTDPRTSVGSDPLADIPLLDQLPQVIRLKYATAANRWTTLTAPPVGLLSDQVAPQSPAPSRPRHRSGAEWGALLLGAGIVDVASVVFRDRFGCWGFLDLWRSTRFTPAEATVLADLTPAITSLLRSGQAATFEARSAADADQRREALVLLLGPDLTMRAQTGQAADYLRRMLPTPEGRSPVPAAAYNVAAQLLAVEDGVDDHPAEAAVHLGGGVWVTLRAARLSDDIAVTIDLASPAERLELFARACGLSARETELLRVLADGVDTREAAARMFLSQHTVQDHLKSIFDKTGSRSRRSLLARL
jgi:DNA-binding CsgD family transcriptional regulator